MMDQNRLASSCIPMENFPSQVFCFSGLCYHRSTQHDEKLFEEEIYVYH